MSHNCHLGNCFVHFLLLLRTSCWLKGILGDSSVCLQPSAIFLLQSNTVLSGYKSVYRPPLMVAPLGCQTIREAPLRTRGTRSLPESGMPHCSSLIHQVWRSHCNKHTYLCHLQNIILLRLSRAITFSHGGFHQSRNIAHQLKSLQRTVCLCLIPVRAKIENINKTFRSQLLHNLREAHVAIISNDIIIQRKMNWVRASPRNGLISRLAINC